VVLICIANHILGENQHLIFNTQTSQVTWSPNFPQNSWTLGNPAAQLDIAKLALLSGTSIDITPSSAFGAMLSSLKSDETLKTISWRQCLPKHAFDSFIVRLIHDVKKLLKSDTCGYYKDIFLDTTQCLDELEHAAIDVYRLSSLIKAETNSSLKTTLSSFKPNSSGFANKVRYDQTATVTGRLIVKEGPMILTLAKRHRGIVKSRYEGGEVISVDYKSIEPRLALFAAGRDIPDDIYADINAALFNNKFTRDVAKVMTISVLYGAQEQRLSQISGLKGSELSDANHGIISYFGIRVLADKLKKQLADVGYITNLFGRKIIPKKNDPRVLVNYFLQSSAVIAAALGFLKSIDFIRANNLKVNPIFIIHDALILDVHPDYMSYINNIKNECTKTRYLDVEFCVDHDKFK